jgi:hypothetical protein
LNTTKLGLVAIAAISFSLAFGQHTIPNTWTPLIGGPQGWPQDTEGRAIHMIHVPPTDLQMGSRGKILFWGVSNTPNGPVQPTIWTPPMAWESSFGTFAPTTQLSYEAFCCGHTLMEDGRVVIGGSNFKTGPYPREPGNEVSIYNPATNSWTELTTFPLNKKRYYPSLYRLTDGRIATFGGQETEPDPNDPEAPPATFVPEPYEINPNKVTLLAAWQIPIDDDWDFLNYPHLYPVSSNGMVLRRPLTS